MLDRLSAAIDGVASTALSAAQSQLASLLANWRSAQRLYTLDGAGPISELMVESFTAIDTVSEPFQLSVNALSLNAHVDLRALLGHRLTLHTTLSDGTRTQRSALVFEAIDGGADGGFTRYQLVAQPWIALLGFGSHSRVWQDRTVVQILDDVLGAAAYSPHAAWQWGESLADGSKEDLSAFLAQGPNAGVRSYCVQYRETDLAFLQRLIAQEGLGWRVEEADDAPSGHRIVFFADSSRWPQNVTAQSLLGGKGIRFHAAGAAQQQDAIQSFGSLRQLNPASTAVLCWDYQNKRAVAAEAPTHHQFGSPGIQDMAPWLEHYEFDGASADGGSATSSEVQHRATCRQQAFEMRNKTWMARSTVRSLRAGQWFTITQSTLDALSDLGQTEADREFTVHTVHSLGINNLPKEVSQGLAGRMVDRSDFFDEMTGRTTASVPPLLLALEQDPELQHQAAELGYANRFEATRRAIPWRPLPQRHLTSLGMQTAIVVGPTGNTQPNGADELHTDAMGRIRVQFHWQSAAHADPRDDNRSSCWVRVVQRWAGAGMGHQFIPRIGQEVLLQFLEGDIDRPICTGALYNGRGEGGLAPTPGGQPGESDLSVYAGSSDHTPSGQGNLIGSGSGGNAPAWHGGAAGSATAGANAQNHAAAMSGVKSKEFGGTGFSQLVFDDTPGQLRVQLATTQHATQLNMGHLVHQADNHRGSYRGSGFELRTDAYGAIRGAQGLLITSYGNHERDPAGDNAPGMALLKQALTLADSFSRAAQTHQTTALATAIGSAKAGQSVLSDKAAAIKALHTAASGMVDHTSHLAAQGDAGRRNTQAADGKLPHSTDPIVAISAKAGLGIVAGQDLQFASGEAISWQVGQDIHIAGGNQLRINTGQSLGILAGAIQAGEGAKGKGLTMIAGQGPVQMQAQAGQAQVAAKGLINVQSANAHIDFASAKKITLSTTGGAQIVIEGGGITVQCPGKITVKAAQKSFIGPASESYALPAMPKHEPAPEDLKFKLKLQDVAGHAGSALVSKPWSVVLLDRQVASLSDAEGGAFYRLDAQYHSQVFASGTTGTSGDVVMDEATQKKVWEAIREHPGRVWLVHGLTSVPLGMTLKSQSEGVGMQERVLDSHNYLPNVDGVDEGLRHEMKGWAEYDHQSALADKPKRSTDI